MNCFGGWFDDEVFFFVVANFPPVVEVFILKDVQMFNWVCSRFPKVLSVNVKLD